MNNYNLLVRSNPYDNLHIEEIISKFWAKAKINLIEHFLNNAFPLVSVTRDTFGVQAVISMTSLTSCFDTMSVCNLYSETVSYLTIFPGIKSSVFLHQDSC